MKLFMTFVGAALLMGSFSVAKDPFTNIENAVGYVIISKGGEEKKYIVVEGKDGRVKIVETKKNPAKVLRQGGKK